MIPFHELMFLLFVEMNNKELYIIGVLYLALLSISSQTEGQHEERKNPRLGIRSLVFHANRLFFVSARAK